MLARDKVADNYERYINPTDGFIACMTGCGATKAHFGS